MATEYITKSIDIFYNSSTDSSSTISRTYTDNISLPSILVLFNGQQIPWYNGTDPLSSFAKFYWTYTNTTSPTVSTTITIHANAAYQNPGYTTVSALALAFTNNDIIFLQYTYSITE